MLEWAIPQNMDNMEAKKPSPKVSEFVVKIRGTDIRKGDIRWCDLCKLEEDSGIKIHKIRPCIIFQIDTYNSTDKAEIFVIPLSGCTEYILKDDNNYIISFDTDIPTYKKSYVCLNRMTFISKGRVLSYIGECPDEIMDAINDYIIMRLGLKIRR